MVSIATIPLTTIICTEVLYTQCILYDSTRIQRYDHQEQHSEVKQQRILRYSFVII